LPRVSEHIEWLNLIDRSGPFLVPAVLEEKFPQGLEKIETPRKQRVRSAYEEWRDAIDESDSQLSDIHNAWIAMVLQDLLEYENEVLVGRENLVGKCVYKAPEHGIEISPDFAVRGDDGKYKILISYWPPETDLEKPVSIDSWPASPLDRMTLLCRANNVRTGLVTDGERWMLVNAPVGGVSGYAAWLARLWWQEPVTLKAFQSLLGVRRCFGPVEDTLDSMLERSTAFQEEVTDTLGEQVRRAVEILIQSLGRADQDRNGDLLRDVDPKGLYEAGLTVMMRLVFTLCAEERGLLLLGDPIYDQFYAISTLRAILREEADRLGIEVLERRHDAWSRLLSTFRSIYGGVEHESLRMPAMGGSLFDPDRFPFLEGRASGTKWKENSAIPLPIDNRTVLLLLEALQILEQKGGAQLLSYRALDVEQIGHVYEGLLECTVARLDEVTVGLIGSQKVRHPSTTLKELETQHAQGSDKIVSYLTELTKRSTSTIKKALEKETDESIFHRLIHACGGDETLAERLLPFVYFLYEDSWGTFLVYRAGSFAVVRGSSRRDTGSHYTPKSLTEGIVEKTLEPVVYHGPAEGECRENWISKSAEELLELKICDPAMGSGAFLVQVCRYLADRLVEAWKREEKNGNSITADGTVRESLDNKDPLPVSLDERIIAARRIIAERCIYGVDINPLAVELAKLSIWLVTMSKGRPFGFLDHNLRCGDSLLGINKIDQITKFYIDSGKKVYQERLFGKKIFEIVEDVIRVRTTLRATWIRDIHDVETMASLDQESRKKLENVELAADAMMGEALRSNGDNNVLDSALNLLSSKIDEVISGNEKIKTYVFEKTLEALSIDLSADKPPRKPFHWPLEFSEVFHRKNSGFDAIVGNPPYIGGQRITGILGTSYRNWLVSFLADGRRGSADLVAYFFLRVYMLLNEDGCFGLLACNTIAEGDTRQVGLEAMMKSGAAIYAAYPNETWPGAAAVVTSRVHVSKNKWKGQYNLSDRQVNYISPFLSDREEWSPKQLKCNEGIAFQGCITRGLGFVITSDEAKAMLNVDSRNSEIIFPYLNGEDINSDPLQCPSRYVINFWDWSEKHAMTYELPYQHILKHVKPDRFRQREDGRFACAEHLRDEWWLYEGRRIGLFHSIGRGHHFEQHPKTWNSKMLPFSSIIALSRHTKYFNPLIIQNNVIPSDATVVFALEDFANFAYLNSSIVQSWVQKLASFIGMTIRFTPSDCFDTLPRPIANKFFADLENIGQRYHSMRCAIMRDNFWGLTNLYNRFHDYEDNTKCIDELRSLHREIDIAVAHAYGWEDLDLDHDFHEISCLLETDRVRFTISETAQLEVLRRLLELNRQRYEEEIKAGLHDKKTTKKAVSKNKGAKGNDDPELF
jgi:hypothetical protein